MIWLLSLLVGILAVEIFMRLPFGSTLKLMYLTVTVALKVHQSSSISDHWKQKAMLKYSIGMLGCTLRLGTFLLALAGMIFLLDMMGQQFNLELIAFLTVPKGLSAVTIVSILYSVGRKRIV